MIYIFAGTDQKKKKSAVAKIVGKGESIVLSSSAVTKEALYTYAQEKSLFGDSPVVVLENMLSESDITLSKTDMDELAQSATTFIFSEDKLLKTEETKFKKLATIERFEEKKEKVLPKTNTFAIADAFGRGDKVTAWVLYRDAIEKGILPEAISGMLFWKIKQQLLSSSKNKIQLQQLSSDLVSLYHRSHRGECDFTIGLEQFILHALSK